MVTKIAKFNSKNSDGDREICLSGFFEGKEFGTSLYIVDNTYCHDITLTKKDLYEIIKIIYNDEFLGDTLNNLKQTLCEMKDLLCDVDTPSKEQRSNIINKIAKLFQ
ncbi:MAG: hypothetical protein M0R17_05190 [Candidatus Omnitrophica bacterium]|jgi:hypothetical protein|nr:hypothetical protein [Candidatus Omnitrophota bacterium]